MASWKAWSLLVLFVSLQLPSVSLRLSPEINSNFFFFVNCKTGTLGYVCNDVEASLG